MRPPSHSFSLWQYLGRCTLGTLMGGFMGWVAGPLVGLAVGAIAVAILGAFGRAPMTPSVDGASLMFAFYLAAILFISGPVLGSLTGLSLAIFNHPAVGLGAVLVIGVSHGALLVAATRGTPLLFFIYASASTLTVFIAANRVAATLQPQPKPINPQPTKR